MIKQRGFTLIELMIASVIGLIIMTGILNLFITTNRNIALSDGLSQNQETGRFTMEFLTRNIRRAGYSEDDFIGSTAALLIDHADFTCDEDPDATDGGGAEVVDACAANNPANALGDRLSIPYVTVPGTVYQTCTGAEIDPDAGGPTKAADVFWVSNAEETYRELRCQTFDMVSNRWLKGASAVSLINNVEGFEFQVGLASAQGNKYASQYVNVDNVDDVLLIRSIRIAILTTSVDELDKNKVQTNIEARKYYLLDQSYPLDPDAVSDGNLKTIFANTIDLPNLIEQPTIGSPI